MTQASLSIVPSGQQTNSKKKEFVVILSLPVLECSRDVYAHFQPDLPDAPTGPLEWVPAVPSSLPARLPSQLMGIN